MYPPPSSQNRRPSDPIGGMPQDKKDTGEPTKLEMVEGNTVREYVTINTGTAQDVGVTRIGDDNWIMAYVHIAHDCQIASHNVIAKDRKSVVYGKSVSVGVDLGGHRIIQTKRVNTTHYQQILRHTTKKS